MEAVQHNTGYDFAKESRAMKINKTKHLSISDGCFFSFFFFSEMQVQAVLPVDVITTQIVTFGESRRNVVKEVPLTKKPQSAPAKAADPWVIELPPQPPYAFLLSLFFIFIYLFLGILKLKYICNVDTITGSKLSISRIQRVLGFAAAEAALLCVVNATVNVRYSQTPFLYSLVSHHLIPCFSDKLPPLWRRERQETMR